MALIKTVKWALVSLLFPVAILLGLSACFDDKPVVIPPGIFSEDWPTALRGELVKNTNCAIDGINNKNPHQQRLTFKSGEALVISGWTFSDKEGTPPSVYVQLVGPAVTYTALAQQRTVRNDVNAAFKLTSTLTPGFELTATQSAEPGEYRIEVLQVGKSDAPHCESNAIITIN